jgi:hypothetical protein
VYYINDNSENDDLKGQQGPYDVLGIIRKIRNGSLKKQHLVSRDDDIRPKPAYQHPDLYDIFIEQDKVDQEQHDMELIRSTSFTSLTKIGFSVLKEDHTAAILTGCFLILMFFIVGTGISMPVIASAVIIPIIGYFCFSICVISILRVSRVQLLSLRYLMDIVQHDGVKVFIASIPPALITFTIPWLLADMLGVGAWMITLIVGIPLMAYMFYVPILIVDRDATLKQAFVLNNRVMRTLGLEPYAIVLGMLLINAMAAFTVIGIIITLPITILGLMSLYDQHFNEY